MEIISLSESVILNNNIKIGKFMGFTEYNDAAFPYYKHDDGEVLEEFSYHDDWNELMKVVDRIEKLGYNFSTRFNHDANGAGKGTHYSFFSYRDYAGDPPHLPFQTLVGGTISNGGGVYSSDNSKLESVYLTVVGFIDFHNQGKRD